MSLSKHKPKVFIGLSGGVDSAVSAYILKKQGFDVQAVFMKNWTGTTENLAGECHWTRERDDAKAVAKKLNIPFMVWDFEREYRSLVIDHFFKEYARGRTPNPDIRCNQFVKIPMFLNRALKEGADYIATGHYVRKNQWLVARNQWRFALLNGIDKDKDQSYFLYTLTQQQLKHLLFPVGDLTKKEVRKIANKIKLPVAEKPDSVGICFIGEVKIEDFLKTRLPEKPGNIIDTKGKVLGQHKGLHFYTIGQRQGLGLGDGPWYVVGRKWKQNVLIVGKLQEQKYLLAKKCLVSQIHWVQGVAPKLPAKLLVCHRYRHPAFPAMVSKKGAGLEIKFTKSQRAITPGQSAVFYRPTGRGTLSGLEVLGGAVIEKVEQGKFKW